jgi:hypothetical protein
MRLSYDNLIDDDATLTSDNGDPNYPLSALQDIHLSNAFRFADLTGGYIDIDLGEAADVSCIGVISNISLTGSITLKGNSSESWTSPPFEHSLTVADRNLIEYFDTETYRYWRLEIDDAGNPEGHIEVNKVFLGEYIQLPGVSTDFNFEDKTLSTREFSPTGQPFSVVRPQRMRFDFSFPAMTTSERDEIRAAYNANGIHTPMWLAIWEESFDVQEPMYVLFEEDTIAWSRQGYAWTTDISFVESK